MLVVETIARIRREHFIKGRTIKEIVRDLKVSRNTVRKVGVGIGFSGTYDGEGAECEATALAGRRSIRFRAVLRKLVAA
jgi:hypothetical protein